MAATITTTYRRNSNNRFTAVIQISGDAAGDVTNQAIMDSTGVIAGVQAAAGMPFLIGPNTIWKIDSIDWEFTGFTGALIWAGATPQLACALPQYDGNMAFKEDTGAPLVNSATTPTGQLLLTTKGLVANEYGTIVITGRHK